MQVCFYFFFSVPVLSNVVAIMSYMNGHVFPEDFHGPHKALMKDDLTISYHSYQISDNYATPGKSCEKGNLALDLFNYRISTLLYTI